MIEPETFPGVAGVLLSQVGVVRLLIRLLRGATDDECTLFATHTIWASEAAFRDWTNSENFRQAHANAGSARDIYLGHPVFEGFHVELEGEPPS